jgi:hypothetical protein
MNGTNAMRIIGLESKPARACHLTSGISFNDARQ